MAYALVIADPTSRLCVLDVNIKDKSLRLVGVYALNDHAERPDLLRQIETFSTSRRVV